MKTITENSKAGENEADRQAIMERKGKLGFGMDSA
jgi:hypothetical protein